MPASFFDRKVFVKGNRFQFDQDLCHVSSLLADLQVLLFSLSKLLQSTSLLPHKACAAEPRLVISILLAGDVQLNPGPALLSRYQPTLDSASSINVRIVRTPDDGHCFIHALHYSIGTYIGVHMPYEMVHDFLAD